MRTLVFGDIHGGLRALTQVFEHAEIKHDDHLIFLGDYVDGWSESASVVDFLISLQQKQKCTFIRGNHDQWCADWLDGQGINDVWYNHGGKGTIASYESVNQSERIQHARFINSMDDYVVDDEKRLFVHAGFTSMHGVEREVYPSNFSWDRTLWEMVFAMRHNPPSKKDPSYPKRLNHYQEIYIGHTPTTDFGIETPVNAMNLWNLDTGAAFKGRLSAMNIVTKEIWQSDPVHTLYPTEQGRNK